jgi:TolB-like protein/tetratricopeptide (TPR) repeat protein
MEMAHVLFMDIVGYSRYPIDEQRAMLAQLQDVVRGTPEFAAAATGTGLISLPTGDGMALVFFGSPEDPAECAVQVVKALRQHAHIQLRLGIHTGPVYRVADINANQNVAGAGINIAQRVMDCGDAGHILVSDVVANALSQLKVWADRLHDLGEVHVKHGVRVHVVNLFADDFGNPAVPAKVTASASTSPAAGAAKSRGSRTLIAGISAAVVLAALTGIGAWKWRSDKAAPLPSAETRRVVAVLPFENIAKDQTQQYFTTGMTEEIQAQLSKVGALRVMSRAAVASYQRAHDGVGAIGRDLGVGSLVSGSVRLAGDSIRVNVQLLDAHSSQTMWSDEYDRTMKDVFAVQRDVALRIASSLQAALTPAESARLDKTPTSSLQAYDLYLKSEALREVEPEPNRQAIALLGQATGIDPSFALAHAQRAVRLTFLSNFGDRRHLVEALTSAKRAVELDPALGRAHYSLAVTYLLSGKISQSRLSFLKAAELAPNMSAVLNDLSIAEMYLGHFDQALYWARRGFALAPNVAGEYYTVGVPLFALGDDTVTEAWLREAERRFPAYQRLQIQISALEYLQGKPGAALDRLRRNAAANRGNMEVQTALAEMLVLTDSPDGAAAFEQLFKEGPESRTYNIVGGSFRTIHAYLLQRRGEAGRAGALLDEAEAVAQRELREGSETADMPLELAAIHLLRGDKPQALGFLEQAYQRGWRLYREAAADPILAGLRDEPGFRKLLARMEADVAAQRKRVDVADNPKLPPAK